MISRVSDCPFLLVANKVAIRRRVCAHEAEYDPHLSYFFCFSRWASFRERFTKGHVFIEITHSYIVGMTRH